MWRARRTDTAGRALRAAALIGLLAAGCFERGNRWYPVPEDKPKPSSCTQGAKRCSGNRVEACDGSDTWQLDTDCTAQGALCSSTTLSCVACPPDSLICDGADVKRCNANGDGFTFVETCDANAGDACRAGGCVNLCDSAAHRRSNVGCEYWAADLDNARISATSNAAAQQFAVVVSNPDSDIAANVVVEQDDADPGDAPKVVEVARAKIPPFGLQVFKLGPREVDGSAPGTFDTGTGTAWTRAAYRVRSTAPVVAYQFNPLENVNVFSNDASLLKPVEALRPINPGLTPNYVALGWPQTIAITDDPRTNFSSNDPINLRAFLTLIGTRDGTHVRLTSSTHVIPGGPIADTEAGGVIEADLGPFDVLNLETGDFNADFTGTVIESDGPVVVFSGNEASDAPYFSDLADRQCCADHLEEQLDPLRTAGKTYIASVSPNRAQALVGAGALLDVLPQPEFFRVLAATSAGAQVATTLSGDYARFQLTGLGSFVDLASADTFAISSDAPILLLSISPSQGAANIPRGLPGGDPSTIVIPSIEQFRKDYVFLTPDKYSFDFVRIIAPVGAHMVFDGEALESLEGCSLAPVAAPSGAAPEAASLASAWTLTSCQLSFPQIDPDATAPLSPGLQNDGVHRLSADRPVGVIVDGFDAYVSYAYAGGTELEFIVPE